MNMKTPEKEWAARLGQQAATKNQSQNGAYREPASRSSLMVDQIGLLLLFLSSPISPQQRTAGYRLLEVMLVQSYQVISQNPYRGRDMAIESTNSNHRAVD